MLESSDGRIFSNEIEEGQVIHPFQTQEKSISNRTFAISVNVEVEGIQVKMIMPLSSGSMCFDIDGLTDQIVTFNTPRVEGLVSEIREFSTRKVRVDSATSTKIYGIGDEDKERLKSEPEEMFEKIDLKELIIEDQKRVKYKKALPMVLTRGEAMGLRVNVFDLPSFT